MIPDNAAFILRNGKKLHGLRDLAKELAVIDKETFDHHVNDAKNDFAQWIGDIFKDATLAEKIRNDKSPQIMADIITVSLAKRCLERVSDDKNNFHASEKMIRSKKR